MVVGCRQGRKPVGSSGKQQRPRTEYHIQLRRKDQPRHVPDRTGLTLQCPIRWTAKLDHGLRERASPDNTRRSCRRRHGEARRKPKPVDAVHVLSQRLASAGKARRQQNHCSESSPATAARCLLSRRGHIDVTVTRSISQFSLAGDPADRSKYLLVSYARIKARRVVEDSPDAPSRCTGRDSQHATTFRLPRVRQASAAGRE